MFLAYGVCGLGIPETTREMGRTSFPTVSATSSGKFWERVGRQALSYLWLVNGC